MVSLPSDHIKADCWAPSCNLACVHIALEEIQQKVRSNNWSMHYSWVYPWRGREEEGEGGRVGVRTSACCSSLHLPSGLSVLTGASLPDLTLHTHSNTHTQAASIMHTETSLYLHTCTLASKCTLTDTTVFLYKPLWSLRWWFWSNMASS